MWHPGYRLGIGIETGYIQLYSFEQSGVETEFGATDITAGLNTVPILVILSMNVYPRFDINVGLGPYILYSVADSHNNIAASTSTNTGFLASGSYLHPINNSISLGGELKYSYINKINDSNLSLQFVFKYTLLEY